MELRSVPFSQTFAFVGIEIGDHARRNREALARLPTGPVISGARAGAEVEAERAGEPLRSSFTTSAVCIEFPVCGGLASGRQNSCTSDHGFQPLSNEDLIIFREAGVTRPAALR